MFFLIGFYINLMLYNFLDIKQRFICIKSISNNEVLIKLHFNKYYNSIKNDDSIFCIAGRNKFIYVMVYNIRTKFIQYHKINQDVTIYQHENILNIYSLLFICKDNLLLMFRNKTNVYSWNLTSDHLIKNSTLQYHTQIFQTGFPGIGEKCHVHKVWYNTKMDKLCLSLHIKSNNNGCRMQTVQQIIYMLNNEESIKKCIISCNWYQCSNNLNLTIKDDNQVISAINNDGTLLIIADAYNLYSIQLGSDTTMDIIPSKQLPLSLQNNSCIHNSVPHLNLLKNKQHDLNLVSGYTRYIFLNQECIIPLGIIGIIEKYYQSVILSYINTDGQCYTMKLCDLMSA